MDTPSSANVSGTVDPHLPPRVIDILLVEDNEGDSLIVRKAFEHGRIANRIHVASDGEEALAFLRSGEGEGDFRQPDLIILDLNLPKVDGRQVLAEIKSDPTLALIPVIVMTNSIKERDIIDSYNQQVNCYLTKPIQIQEFLEVVRSIDYFWIGILAMPQQT